MKLAALDLGSNSFHLLVARIDGPGDITKLGSHKEVLRLGAVVRELGQLSEEAFGSALSAVSRMAEVARELKAEKLLAVATSALREARNGRAFLEACREQLGVDVELLSGDEEARLAYLGARSALSLTTGRVLVADVGGGSVELACGDGAHCDTVHSLPLGFLRLARAFPVRDAASARRLARYVQLECEKTRAGLGRFDTLLLSGGTARALGKLLGGGIATASATQLVRLCEQLAGLSRSELVSAGVDRERALVLPVGAAVIAGVVAGLGQWNLRISPRGLREGLMLHQLSARAHRAA
jgi:exopolyphosphatase / guanosine-5'-triphosphate,3'-diphosphate pyrophosphatase